MGQWDENVQLWKARVLRLHHRSSWAHLFLWGLRELKGIKMAKVISRSGRNQPSGFRSDWRWKVVGKQAYPGVVELYSVFKKQQFFIIFFFKNICFSPRPLLQWLGVGEVTKWFKVLQSTDSWAEGNCVPLKCSTCCAKVPAVGEKLMFQEQNGGVFPPLQDSLWFSIPVDAEVFNLLRRVARLSAV